MQYNFVPKCVLALRKHCAPRLVYVALLPVARSRSEDLLGELRTLVEDPAVL